MNRTEPDLVSASKDAIYDVLIEHAGAWEADRASFMRNWPECREFRFQGDLGFGGKIWYSHDRRGAYAYVACYSEDLNDDRQRIIDDVNKRLAEIPL